MVLLRSSRFENLGVLPDLIGDGVRNCDGDGDGSSALKSMAPMSTAVAQRMDIRKQRQRGVLEVRDRETGVTVQEKIPAYLKLAMQVCVCSILLRSYLSCNAPPFFIGALAPTNAFVCVCVCQAMFGSSVGQRMTSTSRFMLKKMSQRAGRNYDSSSSVSHIAEFVKLHNIKTEEVLEPMHSFKTFNEFFSRALKPNARPLPHNSGTHTHAYTHTHTHTHARARIHTPQAKRRLLERQMIVWLSHLRIVV